MRLVRHAKVLVPVLLLSFAACGGDDDTGLFGAASAGSGGAAGSGSTGKAGSGGSAGTGAGGTSAGSAGASSSSKGGSGGTGGSASKGGASGAGSTKGGAAGQGDGGTTGDAGSSGSGGAGAKGGGAGQGAGANGGSAGSAGQSAGGKAGSSVGGANAGGSTAGGQGGGGTNAAGTSAGGTNVGGSDAGTSGAAGTGGQAGQGGGTCVPNDLPLQLVKRPVDIVMLIDNSASMTEEIPPVESSVYTELVAPLDAAKMDWRFLLVARHGAIAQQSVCFAKPLSGHDCVPLPTKPVGTPRFLHYSVEIGSLNALSQLVATQTKADEHGLAPNGWGPFVRQAARSVFIVVSDDNVASTTSAAAAEASLLGLPGEPFGRPGMPDFVFHSLVGVKAKAPDPAVPYGPDEAAVAAKCSSAVNAGSTYQTLSRGSRGLRAPICELASFPKFFAAVAQDTLATTPVRCEIDPPAESNVVPSSVAQLRFSPSTNAAPETWDRVASPDACTPSSFVADATSFRLCPGACARLRNDQAATLAIVEPCP